MATAPQPERGLTRAQQQLVQANQQATQQLRDRTLTMLAALWLGLGSWRQADIARFVPRATRIVTAATKQSASLNTVFLSRYLGEQVAPAALSGYVRAGVTPADVYERSFHDLWRALGHGASLSVALEQSSTLLQNRAATDIQLAKTQSAQQQLAADDNIVGYRRVLEGVRSCGLCIVASTRRYKREDLMPIHPGCDCSVLPIIGERDPGVLLNAPLLADAHDAINQTFGADSTAAREIPGLYKTTGKHAGDSVLYRDVLIDHQHGEIGPVIAVRGQDFTGPGDLAA